MVVNTLARAGGHVAIPYLKVMLDNPQATVRTAALRGLCSVFLEGPCSLLPSTPPVSETEQTAAFKAWLTVHHPELSSLKAPSWYNTPAPAAAEEIAVSSERHRQLAFHILLARIAAHSPAAAASLPMAADDQQTLMAITSRTSDLLLTNDERLNKANGAARLANRGPDQPAFCRHVAEFERILNAGLSELQSTLSPAARDVLESYLDLWPVHQYAAPAGAGNKWFPASSGSPAACANSLDSKSHS